ncbi:uncharacterized protein AKAME5_001140500 [Lates japonicus]|uniref:SET domain-containing protein n=1 Tax=Lates japonicus TaxID=270547 RepID=A0AAD3R8D0_LATJO|nr:uncharacterized protein AKAME5_001140500 [Lates japonicus]
MEKQKRPLTPEEDALEHIVARRDKPFLEERYIDSFKGRGLFTHKAIEPSTFVVEYRGNIFRHKDTRSKRTCGDTLNNHLYEFSWKGANWCIDASKEDRSLGRLVNDDHLSPNCEMKKIVCEEKPHLCLFAMKKISPGEEITFNYGNSSYPWRSRESCSGSSTSETAFYATSSTPRNDRLEDSADSISDESCSDENDDELPDSGPSHDRSSFANANSQLDGSPFTEFDSSQEATGSFMLQADGASCSQQEEDEDAFNYDEHGSDEDYVPSDDVEAKEPTSVHLHKHIARVFQILNLENDELGHLAKLLGHDIRADRDYYRLPEAAVEVAKIAKLLLAKEKGSLERFKGNSLDEIEIEDKLEPDVEQANPKNSDAEEDNEKSDVLPQKNDDVERQGRHRTPEQDALEHIKAHRDKPFLEAMFIDPHKGRGVFTHKSIEQSAFVVEYRGNIFALKEAQKKKCGDTLNNYVFDFLWSGTSWRIDASAEDATLGRLVNDDHISPNCEMKKVVFEGKPHLCLFALKKISRGEEITYNYGDSSYPWRSTVEDLAGAFSSAESCSDEFVPDDDQTSDNSSTGNNNQQRQKFKNKPDSSKQQNSVRQPVNDSSVQQEDKADYSSDFSASDEEPSCTKKNYCYVCGKAQTKISRHLFTHRHEESDIAAVFALRRKSKERKRQLGKLRNRGNYKHNQEVLKTRRGKLKVIQLRSDMPNATQRFAPCIYCKGMYTRKETKSCERPSLMWKLGNSLRKIGDIKYARALTDDADKETIAEAEIFMKLCAEEWKPATPLKPKPTIKSPSTIPFTQDVQLFYQCMEKTAASGIQSLTMYGSAPVYNALLRVTVAQVSVLNKNVVEVSKVTLQSFNERDKTELHEDAAVCQSQLEKILSKHYMQINVLSKSGKKGCEKKVALTVTPELLSTITLLVSKREACGVHKGNPFLFARPVAICASFYQGTTCISTFAARCGAKNPENLRSALLQKHILRIFQILTLTNDELDQLSKLLGRDIQTNREYYRTPEAAVDIAKISELLSAMEDGSLERFEGKSFEEIEIPDEVQPDVEQEDSENGDTEEDNEDTESPLLPSEVSFSPPKERAASSRKCDRGRGRRKPLDLIMAVVDIKGTTKDFCSVACLSTFKSNSVPNQTPQSLCSMCNKSCTTTCELTLNEDVHKFCSDSCLEDFCREKMPDCDNCCSPCRKKPLTLMLEEDTKTICSEECLQEFKEKTKTPHQCTLCHTSLQMSDMVDYKNSEGMVELFCTRACVTSYKLRPAIIYKLQGKKVSAQLKNKKKGKQSKQKSDTEEVTVASDSTANENNDSQAAESDSTPTLIIADSWVVCCNCGKRLPRGQTVYQPKRSLEVFCSASCLSERHPHIKEVTKTCYNCLQVIMRPHNMILAPVDDSGTMKELCSETCLSSIKSKISMAAPKPPPLVGPRSECRMCARFCYCKFKLTLDGTLHRLCSDTCFINYHEANNLPVFLCDVCSSVCLDKCFTLKMEDGSKTICREECLVKFKEKVKTPQLCPMCQTSHQMSDMVESKNEEGRLDFFCSNRCMMVHKAQSLTVTERNSPLHEECDIKDVKPALPNLDCIKEEPIDEEYNQNLPPSVSTENIKDEPNVAKEDLKIGSVFSLTGDSTSAAPTLAHMDLPASCSNCKTVLMDGETVYQRKGHADIFCATSCLLKFYQIKPVKKTCQFCLQVLTQSQDVLQAPVDTEGTMKDFCSQTCLSSFNYKKIMSTKIPVVPLASHSQCSMCNRYCISKHEIIQQDVIHKVCSDPCFLRFCNMNKLPICENCHSRCSTQLMLKMEDGNKKLCSAECLAQFKKKIQTPQPCAMCRTSNLMSDMVENKNSEDMVELFCTSSCVMASKIQAVSASGIPLNCDNCAKTTVPACHLAMSDASIRNFCTLTCAMAFKESQKDLTAATNPTGAPDQTQSDFLKPPEKLPCAQCRRIIKTTPKVIQKKSKMNFE